MKILAVPGASGPSCRLESTAFGCSVRIDGLSVGQVRYLFGAGGESFAWSDLAAGAPVKVGLDGADDNNGPQQSIECADGTVETVSGAAASVLVDPGHELAEDRFPESLALALAQQWARAGVWVLHAAGIVLDGTGHVLLGGKGHGKSTLTAVALAARGQAISDDWMLFGRDAGDRLAMERLRGFLMLRRGWATQRIQAMLGDQYQLHASRPKLTLSTRSDSGRMPPVAVVDRLWMLERHRGWPSRSSIRPINPARVAAALVAGSMPILLSRRFPAECDGLNETLKDLHTRVETGVFRPGLDVVEQAGGTETALNTLLNGIGKLFSRAGRA